MSGETRGVLGWNGLIPDRVTARLIGGTAHPLETLWIVAKGRDVSPEKLAAALGLREGEETGQGWLSLRSVGFLMTQGETWAERLQNFQATFNLDVLELIGCHAPCCSHVSFSFLLEDFHIMMLPNVYEGFNWTRPIPGHFVDELRYYVPPSLEEIPANGGEGDRVYKVRVTADKSTHPLASFSHEYTAERVYHETLGVIQTAYAYLIEAGIPESDAQMLMPLCVTGKAIWTVNLGELLEACRAPETRIDFRLREQLANEMMKAYGEVFRLLHTNMS